MAADDKHARTEPPTPKRRKEARENGQVARSPDVSGWAAIAIGTYVLPWYFHGAEGRVVGVLDQATHVSQHPSAQGALAVLEAGLKVVLVTVGPLGAIFALVAIVANVAQTGRSFSLKAARPKFERLSPRGGIKRLFSPQNGMQLVKQILKLVLLAGLSYQAMSGLLHEMSGTQPVSLLPLLAATASNVLSFVRVVSLLALAVGVGEYLFQRRKLNQDLKMTKEEVKEETKSSEGDPYVKGQLRRRMYALARSQAIAAVRTADVVVTNPTHYAVALRYEPGRASAPRVVAKGSDALARRIREEAATCSIPVVEDPPLARYLYAVCEVDEAIPGEIYLAVARLLAFVYALPATVRGVGVHHVEGSLVPDSPEATAHLSEARQARVRAVLAGAGAP